MQRKLKTAAFSSSQELMGLIYALFGRGFGQLGMTY